MRLLWYWLFLVCLMLFALRLDHTNALYPVFVFVLVVFFLLLFLATFWRSMRRVLQWLTDRLRYDAQERAIRKRDATTESPLERILAEALDKRNISYAREYQISKMTVDFAFVQQKVVVECDGARYHGSPEQKERDKRRDDELRRRGWRVLRFNGPQISKDTNGCVQRIDAALKA